ncbi:ComF family protein [Inhella sp.]|uniref:ComF family protein n=1 Tax=Inhella sp. TaxID=1921806 RepID=UPI0035B134E6
MSLLQRLHPRAWPLPGGCWVCLGWSGARICADCRNAFARPLPRCGGCALPLPPGTHSALCGHCLQEPLGLTHCLAAVDYRAPWDGLLQALKYRGELGAAVALAELLPEPPPELPRPQALLPVPQHEARLRERGHNPAEQLARALGRRLNLPVQRDWLLRLRDTPTQTQLNRPQRHANLRGAFALAAGAPVRDGHWVIVDDVLTTGATVAALAQELLRHGAASVQAWVVARTPDPRA